MLMGTLKKLRPLIFFSYLFTNNEKIKTTLKKDFKIDLRKVLTTLKNSSRF